MKRNRYRSLLAIASTIAFLFALVVLTLAQTANNMSITGHVKDPQGASLPGATVTPDLLAWDKARADPRMLSALTKKVKMD